MVFHLRTNAHAVIPAVALERKAFTRAIQRIVGIAIKFAQHARFDVCFELIVALIDFVTGQYSTAPAVVVAGTGMP